MYTTRLEEWVLYKNCTMKRLPELVSQMDHEGTKTLHRTHKERIEQYLKRTKKPIDKLAMLGASASEITDDNLRLSFSISASQPGERNSAIKDLDINPVTLSEPPAYETNCPYRASKKRFRLLETFSEYHFSSQDVDND